MNKIYKLEIPRTQFNRIANAFELEDHYLNQNFQASNREE